MSYSNNNGVTYPTIAIISGENTSVGACKAFLIQKKLLDKFDNSEKVMSSIDSLYNVEIAKYHDEIMSCKTVSELVQLSTIIRKSRTSKEFKKILHDESNNIFEEE